MIFTYVLVGLVVISLFLNVVMLNMVMELRNHVLKPVANDAEQTRLQLNAFERLTLFAERSGLKNLVARVVPEGDSAAAMHMALIDTIKAEYEHNVTQQIYVSPEVWSAATRLKDQHIYIINQLASALPPDAKAIDLNKRILDYSMQENTDLSTIVLDAIKFEAKKFL